MAANGLTEEDLGRACGGIHRTTVCRYRHMSREELCRINPAYARMLRAMFPGIPIPSPEEDRARRGSRPGPGGECPNQDHLLPWTSRT